MFLTPSGVRAMGATVLGAWLWESGWGTEATQRAEDQKPSSCPTVRSPASAFWPNSAVAVEAKGQVFC